METDRSVTILTVRAGWYGLLQVADQPPELGLLFGAPFRLAREHQETPRPREEQPGDEVEQATDLEDPLVMTR